MSPKLTRMIEGGAAISGTHRENGGDLAKGFPSGMTKGKVHKW